MYVSAKTSGGLWIDHFVCMPKAMHYGNVFSNRKEIIPYEILITFKSALQELGPKYRKADIFYLDNKLHFPQHI
jgi:hypothetical protein